MRMTATSCAVRWSGPASRKCASSSISKEQKSSCLEIAQRQAAFHQPTQALTAGDDFPGVDIEATFGASVMDIVLAQRTTAVSKVKLGLYSATGIAIGCAFVFLFALASSLFLTQERLAHVVRHAFAHDDL